MSCGGTVMHALEVLACGRYLTHLLMDEWRDLSAEGQDDILTLEEFPGVSFPLCEEETLLPAAALRCPSLPA